MRGRKRRPLQAGTEQEGTPPPSAGGSESPADEAVDLVVLAVLAEPVDPADSAQQEKPRSLRLASVDRSGLPFGEDLVDVAGFVHELQERRVGSGLQLISAVSVEELGQVVGCFKHRLTL